MSAALVGLVAVLIPIVALVAHGTRRWHALDILAAQREVALRRRFRILDEIDRRVADIERYVTSPSRTLDRQFADLAAGTPSDGRSGDPGNDPQGPMSRR